MKNNKKKINVGIVFVSMSILYFSYLLISQQGLLNSKNKELTQLQKNIEEEQKKSERLKQELKNVNTDPYIEKIAREKLGLVKDGEKIFIDINK